jgi:hypothetical protein
MGVDRGDGAGGEAIRAEAILRKIDEMVGHQTFQSIAPCVRQKQGKIGEVSSDRMRVFETERELAMGIRGIAERGECYVVVVSVPTLGLVEPVISLLRKTLAPYELTSVILRRGLLQTASGLCVYVLNSASESFCCGMSIDWVFFYNEVAGF